LKRELEGYEICVRRHFVAASKRAKGVGHLVFASFDDARANQSRVYSFARVFTRELIDALNSSSNVVIDDSCRLFFSL